MARIVALVKTHSNRICTESANSCELPKLDLDSSNIDCGFGNSLSIYRQIYRSLPSNDGKTLGLSL